MRSNNQERLNSKLKLQYLEEIGTLLENKCNTDIEIDSDDDEINYARINNWKNIKTGQTNGDFSVDFDITNINDSKPTIKFDFISIHSEEIREQGIKDEMKIKEKTLELLEDQTNIIKNSCELKELKRFATEISIQSHDDDPSFFKTLFKKRQKKVKEEEEEEEEEKS